jgi:hypothetical protein
MFRAEATGGVGLTGDFLSQLETKRGELKSGIDFSLKAKEAIFNSVLESLKFRENLINFEGAENE